MVAGMIGRKLVTLSRPIGQMMLLSALGLKMRDTNSKVMMFQFAMNCFLIKIGISKVVIAHLHHSHQLKQILLYSR
jgi:hypothetical protein